MKKKLLYLGHAFHLRTRSTQFLIAKLEKTFDVSVLPVDPSVLSESLDKIDWASIDIALVFQLDFLAPIFLAHGIPTVVIPMFDGSENMPPLHWEFSSQARFVSFSRHLHAKILRAGCNSLLVRYYPNVPEQITTDFTTRRGFFWERRPDTGINLERITKIFSNPLETLHVHAAPDIPGKYVRPEVVDQTHTHLTISSWFENKAEMEAILNSCNIYFAPRPSEGIGMGFLEAMARGMVVVANDTSTHNEYISNWDNGILYNKDQIGPAHLELGTMMALGHNARESIAAGRKVWEQQVPELIDWIATTPTPEPFDVDPHFLEEQIALAYSAGFAPYASFLRRNRAVIHAMSPQLAPRRALRRRLREDAYEQGVAATTAISDPVLKFGIGANRLVLHKGWSHDEQGFVWVDGLKGEIRFSPDDVLQRATGITIKCFSAPTDHPQTVGVVVDEVLRGILTVPPSKESEHYLDLPVGLHPDACISLYPMHLITEGLDPRKISVAVTEIEIILG